MASVRGKIDNRLNDTYTKAYIKKSYNISNVAPMKEIPMPKIKKFKKKKLIKKINW